MTSHWLRVALLLAFAGTVCSCEAVKSQPAGRGTRSKPKTAQTGSYIPRSAGQEANAKRDARSKKPKPDKPKRDRRQKGEADEDFVTRGGFR